MAGERARLALAGIFLVLALGAAPCARAELAAAEPAAVAVAGNPRPGAAGGPPDPREVRFEQRLGAQLPLDTQVVDEAGHARPLGDFFGKRPVLLAFAYYRCPNLCTLVLNGLAAGMTDARARLGRDYDAVVVSIDPREGPRLALAKQRSYLARLGFSPDADGGAAWHFLTASPPAIAALTSIAGFRYRYDPVSREYSHPSGAIVVTPEGVISQYLPGIRFGGVPLTAALAMASRSRIGRLMDDVLLLCFHYDPASASERTHRAMLFVRWLGAITVIGLAAAGLWLARKERAA